VHCHSTFFGEASTAAGYAHKAAGARSPRSAASSGAVAAASDVGTISATSPSVRPGSIAAVTPCSSNSVPNRCSPCSRSHSRSDAGPAAARLCGAHPPLKQTA
jgi:hypothetical protein